jgi:hypothetical protein
MLAQLVREPQAAYPGFGPEQTTPILPSPRTTPVRQPLHAAVDGAMKRLCARMGACLSGRG